MNDAVGPFSTSPPTMGLRATIGAGAARSAACSPGTARIGPIEGLEFRGAERASPSEQVLAAIAHARAIFIGPSNPLASIGPILAVPGLEAALGAAPAPIVAVSPVVGGEVLKGPTASFMAFAGRQCSAQGVAELYGELLDGMVADEDVAGLPTLQTETRMNDARARARVAREALGFAAALGG